MYSKHIFHDEITNSKIWDVAVVISAIVFVAALLITLGLTVAFKKQMRAKVKMKWALPIIGLLMLATPLIEDYTLLIYHGQISDLFNNYLTKGDTIVKLSIYVTAFALIFRKTNLISASGPLTILLVGMGIFSNEDQLYIFNAIEYTIVIAGLIFVAIISAKRYSFINFIDSLILGAALVGSAIIARVVSAINISDIKDLKTNAFQTFFNYAGGWEQVLVWASIVTLFLFTFLVVNTVATLKISVKEALALIRVEDKYRKAKIELNINSEEDFSVEALLFETETIDLYSDILIKEELPEVEFNQFSRLQKVFLKSKGIRSPSL